jgi:hypothetical protein
MPDRFPEARAKIRALLARHPDAEWGPAHILLSDCNLEDQWFPAIREGLRRQGDDAETRAVMALLDDLQAIPEAERCPKGEPTPDR